MEEKKEIKERLQNVFCDVFDEDIILRDEMTAEDIEDWDSLTHISLIIACESEFGLKFKAAEVGAFKCVGEMVDKVHGMLNP